MMARRVVALACIVGLLSVQAASTALRTGPVAVPRASLEPGTDATIGGLVAARPLSRLLEAVLPDRALRSDAPLQSWILGGSRTSPELIEDYRALVAASPHPFADAVARWSDFLGAREDPIVETRALERAGHWPRAAQESVALLLYAITDASYQQRIALDALTADEVGRLVRDLPELARGTPEALAQEPAQQALELVARIDMAPIYAGSSLLVRAIDEALPALEAWSHAARLQRDDAAQLQGLVDLARRVPHGDPFEDVLVTLQAAGRVLDLVEASAPVAFALSPRGFVERLKATGFDAGSSWAAVDGLDDLPPDLRRALLHLLSRYAAYAGAADQPMSAQFAHVLGLVESVRDAAPVIEKWSLIFQHLGPGLPKTRQQNLVEFLQLLSLASRPDAPPSDLIRLTATLGGNPRPPGPAPAPPGEAELATEVVRLYHRHGLAPQAADLHALELGVLNLPDEVRTAAALLVRALNDGEEHVVAAERSVADAHADFFAMDGPRRAARAFASEAPSASDMAALREQFQILEELQAASLQAAITISDAANHAHAILAYQDDFAKIGRAHV